MDYLNNTVILLQRENEELKQKIFQLNKLVEIINNQRQSEQKNYISRLHHEEIKVIREFAQNNEKALKNQIKSIANDLSEVSIQHQKQMEQNNHLRLTIQELQKDILNLQNQMETLKQILKQKQTSIHLLKNQQTRSLSQMEGKYKERQQQIINNFMEKLDKETDKLEEKLALSKIEVNGFIKQNSILKQEKKNMEAQIRKMIQFFKQTEIKRETTISDLTKQKDRITTELANLNGKMASVESANSKLKYQLKIKQKQLQQFDRQYKILSKQYQQLQKIKNKQIQKQKIKTFSIAKDLTNHKKYLKCILDSDKKKDKQYNESKKMLIDKIKQIQYKESPSFVDKTVIKTSKKGKNNNNSTFQSVSLDNSFHKDSPSISVSSFMKHQKSVVKKTALQIDTKNTSIDLSMFKDSQTPCFQNSREKNIKKTIKIRK